MTSSLLRKAQLLPLPTLDHKEAAESRLQYIVEQGKARAGRALQFIAGLMPKDYLARGCVLDFTPDKKRLKVNLFASDGTTKMSFYIHRNAMRQAALNLGMPPSWADALMSKHEEEDYYGTDVLALTLTELYHHEQDRYLLRVVDEEVRGILSDSYKRLDSKPLVDAFAKACQATNAVPVDGYISDTRIGLQAILPKIQEPIVGEKVVYGVSFENSDFGNGAMNVYTFMLRVASSTGIISDTGLRKVHLGKKLGETIAWSEETRKKDIELACSQIDDLVKDSLSQERIDEAQLLIRKAYEKQLGDDTLLTSILKKFLSKGEIDRLIAKYNTADVVTLPPGNTVWRLSNAMSWLAQETREADTERSLELQRVAGKLMQDLT